MGSAACVTITPRSSAQRPRDPRKRGAGESPEQTGGTPAEQQQSEMEYAGSARARTPLGAAPRIRPAAPTAARYPRAHLRAHGPAGSESGTHTCCGGGKLEGGPSGAGPSSLSSVLLAPNKRTKPPTGSGRNRLRRPRRGAPPSRTPRLPPAKAAPGGAERVTSRDGRAGGCHGDT